MAKYLLVAATSTIGKKTAEILHAQGHSLFLTGRDESAIAELAAEVGAVGYAALDASDFSATEAIFDQANNALGSIDGAVCFSGSLLLKSAGATSQAEYDATIAANLTAAFAVVRAASKTMHTNGGSVVLISSAAAMEGLANHEAIAAAKGGIIALSRSAAASYASSNLRFNVVSPGLTETKMTKALTANDASRKVSEAMHALGRLGKPEHIAQAITFLLAPENDWITGQVLAVDGGLSRVRPKIKV